MPEPLREPASRQTRSRLSYVQAANAIRSARLNAIDLVDTAEVLFHLKRFQHSLALSILSLEEAAKPPMLIGILAADDADLTGLWRQYRSHRAKTSSMGLAMGSRIRATMPNIPPKDAREIGLNGPSSDELESLKQRAIYSDCYEIEGQSDVIVHQPALAEWRQSAWERLCEAQALAFGLRDIPPAELEMRAGIMKSGRASGKGGAAVTKELYKALVEAGFVKEGNWDTLIADLDSGVLNAEPD